LSQVYSTSSLHSLGYFLSFLFSVFFLPAHVLSLSFFLPPIYLSFLFFLSIYVFLPSF
jgi:hypothetical protein